MAGIDSYTVIVPAYNHKLIGSDANNAWVTRNTTPLNLFNHFNVRWFGAVGDNVTDDTAAIQAAIDAAEAQQPTDGGAVVYFPPGCYLVSSPLVVSKDSITLQGTGSGGDTVAPSATNGSGVIITPTAGFTNNGYVVQVGAVGATRPLGGFRMHGIRIGKLAALSNTVGGIFLKGYRAYLSDIWVDGMTGHGLYMQGRSAAEGGAWNTYETKLYNCHFRKNSLSGIRFDNNTADMHLVDVVSHGNDYGLYVNGAASCHYTGCHFYSNSVNNLYVNGSGSRSKWVGCKLENSGQHNAFIDVTTSGAQDLHFVGCNFNSAGYTANNTYDNLIIFRGSGGNISSIVVSGCTFQWITTPNNGGTIKPRHHINFSSACAVNCRVAGSKYDTEAQSGAVNHHGTAVRCTFNGSGHNWGDPTTTGDWFGLGEEGVLVRDRSSGGTNGVWLHMEGDWVALR